MPESTMVSKLYAKITNKTDIFVNETDRPLLAGFRIRYLNVKSGLI